MNLFRRRPRWRRLRRQQRYLLRSSQVPQAVVDLDPECVERFDRFNALRREWAPGTRSPVETEVLLVHDGPGMVMVWTAPSERVEATRVGRLAGAAVGAYEMVLGDAGRDLAPFAWLTANEVAPGRYHAFVEGHPL